MKNLKKALVLFLCAVLLVAGSVMGTLAYLTSQDSVLNTFTVGDVKIELHETGEEERKNDNDEVESVGLDIHLLPGQTYVKDPTVTVLKNSEACYVRAIVTVTVPNVTNVNAFAANFANTYVRYEVDDTVTSGFNTTNWTVGPFTVSGNTITYILDYKTVVAKNVDANKPLEALFTDIAVPSTLDNAALAELKDMEINVVAQAIQSEGFGSASDAWVAFANQNP